MELISYKDPQGRSLDLIRIIKRIIHAEYPTDYNGYKIPALVQTVQFTREQLINDDGTKKFTDWHCDTPFWPEHDVESPKGLKPNVKLIESEDVTPDTPPEEITVTYTYDDVDEALAQKQGKNESSKEKNLNNIKKPISNEKKLSAPSVKASALSKNVDTNKDKRTKNEIKAEQNTVQGENDNGTITLSKKEYKQFEDYKENLLKEKANNISHYKNKADENLLDKSSSVLKDDTKRIHQKKQKKFKFVAPIKFNKRTSLLTDSTKINLIQDQQTQEILRSLEIIGYYYYESHQWVEHQFAIKD